MMKPEVEYLGKNLICLNGKASAIKLKALDETTVSQFRITDEGYVDIEFLLDYKEKIKYIQIWAQVDAKYIHQLVSTRAIILDVKPKGKIDFGAMPNLRKLHVGYRSCWSDTVRNATTLQFLEVHGWPEKDLTILRELKELVDFSLVDSRGLTNVSGVAELQKLVSITLVGCTKLNDISSLGNAQSILAVDLESCRAVSDLSVFGSMSQLEYLSLEQKEIPSLSFLRILPNLRAIKLGDTVVDDRDMAVLKSFPQLRLVAMLLS